MVRRGGERFIQVKCRTFLSITQGSLSWEGKISLMTHWASTIQKCRSCTQPRSWHDTCMLSKGLFAKGWPGPWGANKRWWSNPGFFHFHPSCTCPRPPTAQACREINTWPLLSPQCCPAEAIRGILQGLQAGQRRGRRAKRPVENSQHSCQRES